LLPKPHRYAVGIAPLLLAAWCCVACSGASQSAGAGACDTPGVTPTEIKLGVVYPDSGPLAATFAAARAGIDARIGEANAAGGIRGRRIAYEWRDDAGDPAADLTATRQLVENENVFGIVAVTAAFSASAPYLSQKNVPVTGMAAEPVWSEYTNMFTYSYTGGAAVDTYGRYARANGGTKAVVVETSSAGVVSDLGRKMLSSMSAAGVATVGSVEFNLVAGDPEQAAREVVDKGADTIIGLTEPVQFARIVSATRRLNRDVKVALSFSGYDPDLLRTVGPSMAGISMPVFYRPFEAGGDAIDRYRTAMVTYSSRPDAASLQFAMIAYINTDMFIRGLQEAGSCPTRDGFIAGLHNLTDYDAGGLIHPYNIRKDFAAPSTCMSFVRVNPEATAFVVSALNTCGSIVPG